VRSLSRTSFIHAEIRLFTCNAKDKQRLYISHFTIVGFDIIPSNNLEMEVTGSL
jgi:hypothetical protein